MTSDRTGATSGRGARAKASASGSSAGAKAGDGAKAGGGQGGDSEASAAQSGDPVSLATADPVATGAQATEDSDGALPFTGSGVALLAAIGLVGIGAGLLLRRRTRRVTRVGA